MFGPKELTFQNWPKLFQKQTDATSSQKVPLANLRKLAKGTLRMPFKHNEHHTIRFGMAGPGEPKKTWDGHTSQIWIKLFQVYKHDLITSS